MKPCPVDLWESLAREDESATFFQTPAWHRIAARHFRAESAPLLFEFPDGPACLPLLRDRRWGRWRYFSPFGTYTAVVCPRALSVEERTVIERVLSGLNVHLVSSPFTQNPVRVGTGVSAHTQVVNLPAIDPSAPERSWNPDPRRKLRMAREAGVTIRIASSRTDWDAYFSLYEKSLQRWGQNTTSRYPRPLFDQCATLPSASMHLWVAEHDGRMAAGYIAFYHGRHAGIWHGASDPELYRLGAVQALYAHMIADAASRQFTVFDLLGSGGIASLEAFKKSFGADTLSYVSSLHRTGVIGLIARSVSRRRRS
jgi:hypothetical protein